MKLFLKLLRNGLGQIIILIDYLTRPKKMHRSEAEQKIIDVQTSTMSMYQFYACPFCVRTRRALHCLNLNIETRDAMNDAVHRQELLTQGGEIKVPCLRVEQNGEIIWMYESLEIIRYLDERFGTDITIDSPTQSLFNYCRSLFNNM